MKRLIAIAASLCFAASALAQDAHQHADASMQEHMKLMREEMAKIRAATDPKERERLMAEHMKTMEQSMSKMQGRMGCGKM
jgi:hypothetical protein